MQKTINDKKQELFIEERQEKIFNYINDKEKAFIEEIMDVFNISKSTVRRDLIDLAKKNLVIRTRGGALKKKFFKYESTLDEKKDLNLQKKIEIARVAWKYVQEGDAIYISGGTTTLEFVKLFYGFSNLKVFTNAFNILSELANRPDIKVKFLGGDFRKKTLSCVGMETVGMMQNYNFDKSFIGANGVSIEEGITTPNELEAKVDREVIKRSRKSYVLVDDTKFGSIDYSVISPIHEVDNIITNKHLEKDTENKIKEKGVNLIYGS